MTNAAFIGDYSVHQGRAVVFVADFFFFLLLLLDHWRLLQNVKKRYHIIVSFSTGGYNTTPFASECRNLSFMLSCCNLHSAGSHAGKSDACELPVQRLEPAFLKLSVKVICSEDSEHKRGAMIC